MTPRFLLLAQEEFEKAIGWFDAERKGLGLEFASEVYAAIDRIADFPHSYPCVAEHVRVCPLKRFRYVVLYEITTEEIVIHSVFHRHRAPEAWQSRVVWPEAAE